MDHTAVSATKASSVTLKIWQNGAKGNPDVLCTQQNEFDLKILHILARTLVFRGQG